MDDDDAGLKLLERTPPETPGFQPHLDGVVRRSRAFRRRRLAGRAGVGLGVMVAMAVPLLVLGGLLRGGGPQRVAGEGPGRHAVKLTTYYEPSGSMEPTVKIGQTVLVDTNAYLDGRFPQTGDLVVFRWQSQGHIFQILKRVIGLPGQTIVIRRGVVLVDQRRLGEPYLNPHRDLRDSGPFVVRPGHVFVLGDNRINSNDSRYGIGQVAITDVIGKVVGFASGGAASLPTAGTAQP